MNQKKSRKLRKKVGYNPGKDSTKYRITNKTVDEKGHVTATRVCVGKRAEYLAAKRSA